MPRSWRGDEAVALLTSRFGPCATATAGHTTAEERNARRRGEVSFHPVLREIAEYPNSFGPLGPKDERIETDCYTLCTGPARPGTPSNGSGSAGKTSTTSSRRCARCFAPAGAAGRNGRSAAAPSRRTSSSCCSRAGSSPTRIRIRQRRQVLARRGGRIELAIEPRAGRHALYVRQALRLAPGPNCLILCRRYRTQSWSINIPHWGRTGSCRRALRERRLPSG
jgi:hypothetical protein